jgi:LmbE family N-acetylglucosaminyl deacetylase
VVFAAHPDDETVGAAAVLMRFPLTVIIFLTDGAPRDVALRSPDATGSRSEYMHLRSKEAAAALQIAGVGWNRVNWCGIVDQEAIFEVMPQALHLARVLREIRPDVVITHPYEGGHPDHDAAALIVRLASELLLRASFPVPDAVEMTSYHARDGMLITGQFLASTSDASQVIELNASEIDRKKSMIDSYRSQWRVLQSFGVDSEMLRTAPRYDFSRPPHPGNLWYECLGWQMTGLKWRSLAAAAMAQMDLQCV